MAAPIQGDIYRPALEYALEVDRAFSLLELKTALRVRMNVSETDLLETTKGGTLRFYKNVEYVDWKLRKAGFTLSGSGGKQITDAGRTLLKSENGTITSKQIESEVLKRINSPAEQASEDDPQATNQANGLTTIGYDPSAEVQGLAAEDSSDDTLPEEMLQEGHLQLQAKLFDDLSDMVSTVSPTQFERIAIGLMEAMGYGTGEHTGGRGDEGIDGVVRDDPLGLGTVYCIQAKQWKQAVDRKVVDEFAGSIKRFRATGGIIATTDKFTSGAISAAQDHSIVLIDGIKLVQLMIEHGVGVVTERTYEIKKLDENYFSDEQ